MLFVGEALVGNEAVDQLTKFNQALADHSNMTNPRLIDGIILTKFDTIDDKVREFNNGCSFESCLFSPQPVCIPSRQYMCRLSMPLLIPYQCMKKMVC